MPYSPAGYNPILGIPGLNSFPQPGGPFALTLIAKPHTQATHVVSYSLDYAPSDDTSPIGVTLTLSGPINLSNLFVPDIQETALEVVDSSGQQWPLTTENYNAADSSLQMTFDRPLPPGRYTLISPPGTGWSTWPNNRSWVPAAQEPRWWSGPWPHRWSRLGPATSASSGPLRQAI